MAGDSRQWSGGYGSRAIWPRAIGHPALVVLLVVTAAEVAAVRSSRGVVEAKRLAVRLTVATIVFVAGLPRGYATRARCAAACRTAALFADGGPRSPANTESRGGWTGIVPVGEEDAGGGDAGSAISIR